MRKSLAALILGVGAAFFIAYLCGTIGKRDRKEDRAFEPVAWQMGDRRVRGAMAADLEHSAHLIGLRKAQVLELLGPPDASDTSGHTLSYVVDLGLRTGPWGMGGPWLFQTTVAFDTISGGVSGVRTGD